MIGVYYFILFIAILLTAPTASAKVAFHYDPDQGRPYTTLGSLQPSLRRMYYAVAAVLLVMMVMMCVNRSEFMPDYSVYQLMYSNWDSTDAREGVEPTFAWMCKLSPTFLFLLGLYATVSCSLHLLGIFRNAPNLCLSMMIYLGYSFVFHDMIQIRAAVACGILLISIRYIYNRNWVVYYLLTAVAIMFHYSALAMVFLYFLPAKKMYKWFWIGIVVLILGMSFAGIQLGSLSRYIPLEIVEFAVENYLGNRTYAAAEAGPMRIIICIILIVMILKIDDIKKYYPFAPICVCISIFSQAFFLLCGDIPVMQGRMGEFLGVADIFTYAMIPLMSRKHYYVLILIPVLLTIYLNQSVLSMFNAILNH